MANLKDTLFLIAQYVNDMSEQDPDTISTKDWEYLSLAAAALAGTSTNPEEIDGLIGFAQMAHTISQARLLG